jgi:hypothetical protein
MSSLKGCLSKFVGIFLFVTLVGVLSSSVQAQVTNLSSGGSVNFSNLVGATGWTGLSVMIGDKLFGNFGFQFVDQDMNAGDQLVPADLVLSALSNQVGFGVSIQLPLASQGPVLKDLKLQFTAQVTNSNDLISDLHLDFTGSATGYGVAQVSESVFTNGFGTGLLTSLALSQTSAGYNPSSGQTNVTFVPFQSKIWIQKDIFVDGNLSDTPDGNQPFDLASITIIDQTFSQIPEPGTMALLGAGMAGLLIVRRRK